MKIFSSLFVSNVVYKMINTYFFSFGKSNDMLSLTSHMALRMTKSSYSFARQLFALCLYNFSQMMQAFIPI